MYVMPHLFNDCFVVSASFLAYIHTLLFVNFLNILLFAYFNSENQVSDSDDMDAQTTSSQAESGDTVVCNDEAATVESAEGGDNPSVLFFKLGCKYGGLGSSSHTMYDSLSFQRAIVIEQTTGTMPLASKTMATAKQEDQ